MIVLFRYLGNYARRNFLFLVAYGNTVTPCLCVNWLARVSQTLADELKQLEVDRWHSCNFDTFAKSCVSRRLSCLGFILVTC